MVLADYLLIISAVAGFLALLIGGILVLRPAKPAVVDGGDGGEEAPPDPNMPRRSTRERKGKKGRRLQGGAGGAGRAAAGSGEGGAEATAAPVETEEEKEARLAAEEARRRRFMTPKQLKEEERRRREEEKERAREAAEAEAAEAAKEAEEAEYAQWSGLIEVEGGGEGAAEAEAERQGMLTDFVDYIKRKKVVVLEELAAEFGLKTKEAIKRVEALEEMGKITGVVDDRGKFIYVTPDEMAAVADFINRKGRVSQADLAAESNRLVDLTESKFVADAEDGGSEGAAGAAAAAGDVEVELAGKGRDGGVRKRK